MARCLPFPKGGSLIDWAVELRVVALRPSSLIQRAVERLRQARLSAAVTRSACPQRRLMDPGADLFDGPNRSIARWASENRDSRDSSVVEPLDRLPGFGVVLGRTVLTKEERRLVGRIDVAASSQ